MEIISSIRRLSPLYEVYEYELRCSRVPLYPKGLKEEKGLHLKAVEASGLGHLDLLHEPLNQVFVDDAVGSREECEDVRHEMLLLLLQLGPVRQVL